MSDGQQAPSCRTCKRWGYHFEDDPKRRTCILLGSPMSKQTGQESKGNAGVRTDADFYCAEHTPKKA